MKNQLKFLALVSTLALAAVPALHAQPAEGKEGRKGGEHAPGAMMERAAKELGLTADQEAKWKAIGQKEKAALEALREDTSVDKKDKRAKMRELNKGFADQRRALLTADQAKKFDEMRAKARERMEDRREHGPKDEKPEGK